MAEKGMKKLIIKRATYLKPRDIPEEAPVRGYYVFCGTDQYDKPAHKLRTSEGDITINSATDLDGYMEQVTLGQYVTITRLPTKIVPSGKNKGKPWLQFDVEVDERVEALSAEVLAEAADDVGESTTTTTDAPAPRKPSVAISKVK